MDNNYTNGVKIDMLRNMYRSRETNKVVFDYLAERQRNYSETRPETLISRLYERDITATRAEMISFFRNLQKAGCGKYIEGRRGHYSRFQWHVRMSDVGRAASGTAETVEEISNVEETFDEDSEKQIEEETATITHEFKLRPDFTIKLSLPVDFRNREAARLSDWVKTLPFEEQ